MWESTQIREEACWSRERWTEAPAGLITHRHIPRPGSSGVHPPAQPGLARHSEGVRHPEDSAGIGSHGLAGLLGKCAGHSLVQRWAVAQSTVSTSVPLRALVLPTSALSEQDRFQQGR